jgi:VanZ family protein
VARGETGIAPDLAIPPSFLIPHKRFLTWPTQDFEGSRGFQRDILINIAGFLVLGFFFCVYRAASASRFGAALQAILAGFAVSLAIEALQMFLPTRTSSIVDLGANTLGAALGALLALAFLFLKPAPQAEPG